MRTTILPGTTVRSILGDVSAEPPPTVSPGGIHPPYITVSRQVGAGGRAFGQELLTALNRDAATQTSGGGTGGWTLWDQDLVKKVAADYHLSEKLIEGIENAPHNWMADFLNTIPGASTPPDWASDTRIVRRVGETIRSLAAKGRVILVGLGSAFVTRKIPGGIRVRLVAPRDWRIANMARQLNLDPHKAKSLLLDMERNREAFYHRFWPDQLLDPENFTVTFNVAQVTLPEMADAVKSIVARHMAPAPAAARTT